MRRALPVIVALVAALLLSAPAAAQVVVHHDWEGRPITFDVQVPGVDVEWYAEILRGVAHGDEIARVTIRIVAPDDLHLLCGAGAGGCYAGGGRPGRIVVPAGRSAQLAHVLVHEYGHHVDFSHPVPGIREPNGTPGWWAARDMARRLQAGEVSQSYALGWERAVAEIFAEDYVQLHLRSPYRIRWLTPPDETVLAALRAELVNAPLEPVDPPAPPAPVVINRRATLAPGRAASVEYELLGPGRRVTFTARLAVQPPAAAARMEIRCQGEPVLARPLARGRATTMDLRNRGPSSCRAVVRNTGRTRATFALTLRLAREGVTTSRYALR